VTASTEAQNGARALRRRTIWHELLTKVWKEPCCSWRIPRAIAAFGRECTRRGVPPPTVTLFGTPFLTWRGVPLIPSDKIAVRSKEHKSKILLLRVGEKSRLVGLFQPDCGRSRVPAYRSASWASISARWPLTDFAVLLAVRG